MYLPINGRYEMICKHDSSLSHSQRELCCVCVSPHDGAESPYTTKAVVFTSSHQQHQFVLHSGALCLRLLTLAHSATPTLPLQMHSSTRSGSSARVLLSNVLSRWMRLMWVLWLNHQSWGKTNSNAGGPLAPTALP